MTSLISSVKNVDLKYRGEETYSTDTAYEDSDDDTHIIARTPRGRSITRVYPGKWSLTAVQPMPAVRTRDIGRERVTNRPMNIDTHDAGMERAFDHIMSMGVYDTGNRKASEPLTYVKASNTSVEKARGYYVENSYGSGVLGDGDIDMDTGANHPITESASACIVTDKVPESSGNITSDLPLRALLREQEDYRQQPSSFSLTLDKPSQEALTRITSVAPSGANNEPLGSGVRKRSAPDWEEVFRASKFRMAEDVVSTNTATVQERVLIDLTIPDNYIPPHRRQPVLSNITNTQNTGYSVTTRTNSKGGTTTKLRWNPSDNSSKGSRKIHRQRAAAVASRTVIRTELTDQNVSPENAASKKTFNKVFNRLSAFRTGLIKDREALSNRWVADNRMKEPGTIDRMQQLGDYMRQIDEALGGAIEVVNQIK